MQTRSGEILFVCFSLFMTLLLLLSLCCSTSVFKIAVPSVGLFFKEISRGSCNYTLMRKFKSDIATDGEISRKQYNHKHIHIPPSGEVIFTQFIRA